MREQLKRHSDTLRGEKTQRAATMKFLRARGLYYTSIDAPEDKSIVPSFIEATGDQVGKNRDNWFKHGITPPPSATSTSTQSASSIRLRAI